MANVDQAVVDEILAKAAEDTEEGRLEKLEKEVETLKGSIKRLLLDIRETLNKLENPFVNLQSLAEANIVPQSTQQVQIIPAKIPEEEKPEEVKRDDAAEKEKKVEDKKLEKEVEKAGGVVREVAPADFSFEGKVKVEPPAEVSKAERRSERTDLMTLYRLAEWVGCMTSKHGYEAFKLALDVFEMTGYINAETRQLLMTLAEVSRINGAKDLLIELYRLNKVLRPDDKSLDTDLLALLLEKR